MLRFRSLTAKFIFMGSITLASIVAYITATYIFTHHINGEAKRINFAGHREKVTIGLDIIASLIIIGQEQGFFSQEGLDLTTKKYPTGKAAFEGMFTGEVDMASVAETPIVFKSFEQQDFSIISALGSSDPKGKEEIGGISL